MSRSKEIKKLDAAFSKWIRHKDVDSNGLASCWTCGVKKKPEAMHAGHFMSRSSYSTRWLHDEESQLFNVLSQCPRCNLFDQNQNYIFGRRLDEVYGKGTAEKIYLLSKQTKKYTLPEIIAMRKQYEQMLKDLDK